MKRCSKCHVKKNITEFKKDRTRQDGRFPQCKICSSAGCKIYYNRNKKKILGKQKVKYRENKEEVLARNKKWREKNKNKKREIDKIYREKNKEILREKKKLYREKNKESIAKKKKRHLERPALFHTYNERLSYAEETRIRDIYLEIKCTYCGIWYLPNTGCVIERIRTLEGHKSGEQRLYCSEECKKECPIYSQSKYPKGFKPSTSREVQPELRQMVFERDEWTCQRCESTTSLHCHHITGVEQNPIESADIDNCITLCKDCHKYVHSQEGCRYFDLRRCA